MASLFKNGEEVARLTKRRTQPDSVTGVPTEIVTTYSIRSNGWVLKKSSWKPHGEKPFGGTWKRVKRLRDVDRGAALVVTQLEQHGYARA